VGGRGGSHTRTDNSIEGKGRDCKSSGEGRENRNLKELSNDGEEQSWNWENAFPFGRAIFAYHSEAESAIRKGGP